MPDEIKSKGGTPIVEGDKVFTKIRGGKHEGEVEQIITDPEEAANTGAKGAKKAPLVLFTDQNGKTVAHKPGTLHNLNRE